MADGFPPATSCIYEIRCIPTGKIYIGSATNLRTRWYQHVWSLKRRRHPNWPLQQAWNKYGERRFKLSMLETVEESELLQAEQVWLDGSGCTDKRIGFNLKDIACATGKCLPKTWPGFIDPSGNPITIVNLWSFCRQHGLNASSMYRLARGRSKLKSCKGWTHVNSVRQREFIKTHEGFIAPDGSAQPPIRNLAAFCRERRLTHSHMIAVAKGRICSHRGWTHRSGRGRSDVRTYTGFVDPQGRRVSITNLNAFCRDNGLSVVHMHNVKSGQRRSHKGWTWQEQS
jgi:hypothetical protein